MKRIATLALASLLASTLPAAAARPADDALALVPADAVTAGMLRVSDLRTSPLAARFFDEMDRATVDGDAARFLSEARLHPVDDVDLVVFAATNGEKGKALVAFEGRFEPRRLAAAAAARGAEARTAAGATYFLLKDDRQTGKRSGGAVAFVSDRLLVAGSEEGVAAALAARAAGGTGFDRGAGLGAWLDRVNGNASGWLLVDRTKLPEAKGSVTISGNDGAVRNVIGAMNLVSAFTLETWICSRAMVTSKGSWAPARRRVRVIRLPTGPRTSATTSSTVICAVISRSSTINSRSPSWTPARAAGCSAWGWRR